MSLKNLLADDQLSSHQLLALLQLAKKIKHSPNDYGQALAGKSIVTLFEKPSLRTHVSFDIGIQKLGGHALYIGQQNGQLGERERIQDLAKNLSCWADAIVARVFKQESLIEMAEYASVPVINALSDVYHPCQALADFLTLSEHFSELSSVKLAYVGDGNNVANSLMLLAGVLGMQFTLLTPTGYGANAKVVAKTEQLMAVSGGSLRQIHQLDQLAEQDALYTDTWISMGDNTEVDEILTTFMPYQVNHAMMAKTGAKVVMHCQPAHLGQEISTALFDSELSLAFEQANNRLWAQNALLVTLLNPELS